MATIVFAVLPVFLMLFVGNLLRRVRFLDEAFWPAAEKLTFMVLIPALLLRSVATADLSGVAILPMAGAVVATILVGFALSEILRRVLDIPGPAHTSVVQGTIRFNVYIALPVIAGVFGPEGVALVAVPIAVIPPTVNVLSIWSLARHGAAQSPTLAGTALTIARNPFILATLAGALLNVTAIGLPPVIRQMVDIMADASLLIGLLVAGAGLRLTLDRSRVALAVLATGLRFVVMPAVAFVACLIAGIDGIAMGTVVVFSSVPTATASYVLARQMGGDADLMAVIITLQTGLGLISIPLTLYLIGAG
ncbi:AEC family transporter [Fodinicurvata sp. EGI_FJ10296]|uniref:AEC family transporter n=1 Tax=Fodinicurvata sp. EGI_FJ10296 TaxID=3231908 RepID=UPI003454B13F